MVEIDSAVVVGICFGIAAEAPVAAPDAPAIEAGMFAAVVNLEFSRGSEIGPGASEFAAT
jgi:hypothetical protein